MAMHAKFRVDEDISYMEIFSVNYDQWNLTVTIRAYEPDPAETGSTRVKGLIKIVFAGAAGFRCLAKDEMLVYPFPEQFAEYYVHRIEKKGWCEQENEFGNINRNAQEYLVATAGDCVCVLFEGEPEVVKEL